MGSNSTAVIVVRGVSKFFEYKGKRLEVLRDINLEVERGNFVTIVGPSGTGKSTFLSIVAGLLRPSSGKVFVDGVPVEGPRPDRIAMVFQDHALLPWRTVIKNVEFGLEVRGVPKEERRSRAQKYIDLVGVSGFEDYYPSQISGGMKHRVAIARALVLEPEVLLMDEPFVSLDEQTRYLLGSDLVKIWRRTGKTILFVTHSISEACTLATHVVIFTKRPASVKEVVKVNADYPRDPEDTLMTSMRRYVWNKLKEEIAQQEIGGGPE